MSELGKLPLTGKSGKAYDFVVYSSDTTFNTGIACVYYVSKRTLKSRNGATHTAIYVGETEDIKDRLTNHHKQSCFDRNKYNAVSIFKISTQTARSRAEQDLIDGLDPLCNG